MPWQNSKSVGLVAPVGRFAKIKLASVQDCIASAERQALRGLLTPALSIHDAQPFYEAGFELHERLHLLELKIDTALRNQLAQWKSSTRVSTGRPWHNKSVLTVDADAFDDFWRFDKLALTNTIRATPSSWYRVAHTDNTLVGYAVTGLSANRGYLQRLAVSSNFQGRNVGRHLVADAIYWLNSRGARHVSINTQQQNLRALSLYEHLGFVRQPAGLVVLRWGTTS